MDRWTAFEIGSNDCGNAMILRVPVQDHYPLCDRLTASRFAGHTGRTFQPGRLASRPLTGADPFMTRYDPLNGRPDKAFHPTGG